MTSTQYGSSKPSFETTEPSAGLLSFASMTIHGIGSYEKSTSLSGTFKRSLSFPAPVHTKYLYDATIPVDTWSPLPPPTSGHLELHLGAKFGEGTSGVSYAANVRSSTALNMPKRICVKWAKGEHCRTLARDAWFYEQLHRSGKCEGIITPRCYGFFTMKFEDLLKGSVGFGDDSDTEPDEDADERVLFKPWENLNFEEESLLPDDASDGYTLCEKNFCDDADLKADSMWAWWSQRKGSQRLIAVLLLEELGNGYPWGAVDEASLSDIREIATDLGHTGIQHYDLRSVNILRSLEVLNDGKDDQDDVGASYHSNVDGERQNQQRGGYCERHQKFHAWRLIDFDRATKTIFQDSHPEEQRACLEQGELVGNEYFMGTLKPWVFPYLY